MKFKKQLTFLIIMSSILATVFIVDKQTEAESSPNDLVISGLVDHSINFTYSELQRFPMVSEVAPLQCVGDPEGQFAQLYNWTGIPLFFLLNATGVKAGAKEVVFYASDGFSSSLTIERALHPTTLLALQANGTVLTHSNGYPYRLVVPCKWGYKWVKWITEIEVVDYDYKGTYESWGYSDEADIPNCPFPPSTTPPFETLHIVPTYSIIALSNSTIDSFDYDTLGKQIYFNVTGLSSTTGYFYVTIPKELLWCDNSEQWEVWANDTLIDDRKIMETTNSTRLYFTYNHSIKEIQIKGVHMISIVPDDYPTIQEAVNAASLGDRVYVKAGTYYENVVLNKTLSLVGENRDTTIIDGNGLVTSIVHITANNVTIREFTIQNGGHIFGFEGGGIYITNSNRNNIVDNTITNTQYGINLGESARNIITSNNIIANDAGIQFLDDYSSNSTIYHNNFINNGLQVSNFDASSNTWDNSYPSGGNYWSDHNPPDSYSGQYQNEPGGDGIGDISYIIDENNTDRYPLIHLYDYVSTIDLNNDRLIDIVDIVTVAIAFGSRPGDPNWNPMADINQDGIIDIIDLVMVSIHFGETYP